MPNHRRLGLLGLLLALLWAGCGWAQSEFSPDTGSNFGARHSSFQGAPAGPTCIISGSVTTLTPDPTRCHVYGVQLGTSLTIKNPPPGTLLPGEPQVFELQQPSTGSTITPVIGTNYHLPGGASSLSGLLSTALGMRDLWSCQGSVLDSPSQLECQNPTLNIGPLPTIVAHSASSAYCNQSTSATTCSSQPITLAAGTTLAIFDFACANNGCTAGTAPTVSSQAVAGPAVVGTCALATGTRGSWGSGGRALEAWLCPVTTGGSTSITTTWGAAANWQFVWAVDVSNLAASPDAGIGNFASGTSTTPSVTTTGATTQANEMILAVTDVAGNTFTPGAGETLLDGLDLYFVSGALGSQTASGTAGASTAWGMSIVALKHP